MCLGILIMSAISSLFDCDSVVYKTVLAIVLAQNKCPTESDARFIAG